MALPLSPPPLSLEVMAPIEKLTAEFWPGAFPSCRFCRAGATDSEFTNAVGMRSTSSRCSPVLISATFTGSTNIWACSRCSRAANSCIAW